MTDEQFAAITARLDSIEDRLPEGKARRTHLYTQEASMAGHGPACGHGWDEPITSGTAHVTCRHCLAVEAAK